MKKHILFIVENASVPLDLRVWQEAVATRSFGYDVTVISPMSAKTPKKYECIEGIAVYRHPAPFQADTNKYAFVLEYLNALFWEFVISLRVFVSRRFHFIHAANPPDHIFLLSLFYKIFGVKYIFDHHDICPENYHEKFQRRDFLYRILLLMERLTFYTADAVISTNESYKRIAVNRGGMAESEVFVVRNGPDLSRITFMEPNEGLKKGFDYLVAYLGVIGNQEGIDNLLRAVKYIVYSKGINNIKFIIMGTGPHWEKMVRLSRELKLEENVIFTGFVPYNEMYETLATADLCVNPEFRSDFTDQSTMIKIMDYMVFKNPIVQFETREGKVTAGEAAEYVKNNDEIEFAETIIRVLNNSKKREKMGEIGRKRIDERLNWEKQKVHLKRAYDYLEAK